MGKGRGLAEGVKRGEVYSVSAPGDYGKPRPALILQADALNDLKLASVLVCPMTSTLNDAPLLRISISPTEENGLEKESQLMVDKVQAISLARIGGRIGKVDQSILQQVNRSLLFVLGLG